MTSTEIDFIVDQRTAYEVKLLAGGYDLKKLKKIAEKIDIKDYKVISLDKVKSRPSEIIYPFGL